MKRSSCSVQLCVGALLGSIGSAAHSEVPAADNSSAGSGIQEEIVVTARKREESLQDVPLSIQAIGEQQINSLGATTLRDLNGVTPDAHIDAGGNITIRGISSNARNAGFEAGAAVYIDGVYQGRPIGNNLNLVDVQRVEVLRGPQGTLFGKNTTAGAINIVSIEPGDKLSGRFDVRFGQERDLLAMGYVAGPLIDQLVGAKVSVERHASDGYQHNVLTGQRTGNYDRTGANGELRFTPGQWILALRGDFTREDSNNNSPLAKPVAGFDVIPGMDNVNQNVHALQRIDTHGVSLTADRNFAAFTLTSITAWRGLTGTSSSDDDFTPLNAASHYFVDTSEQYSQELRLTSSAGERLDYVIGAYYFNQRLHSDRPVTIGPEFPVQGVLSDVATTKTDAFALFGTADYRLTDILGLSAGLRYTREIKHLDFVQLPLLALGYPPFNLTDRFTNQDLSPSASLTAKLSRDLTVYARYSKGFKSGGWNPDITQTPNIRFNPESVENYEAGVRTHGLDNLLGVNLTGYHMKYKDLQVSQFLGTFAGYVITNAASAKIDGAELELSLKPLPWVALTAGGAYNRAVYQNFDSGIGVNYAGQQFTYAPRLTWFVAGDIEKPIASGMDLIVHGDYRHQSTVYFDDSRSTTPVGPSASNPLGIANARIGVRINKRLEISAYGDNLTNVRQLLARSHDALGLGLTLDDYGPPREYGGRVTYSF